MHDVSTLQKKYPLNPAPGLVGINIMNKQLQQYHRYLSMPLTHTWPIQQKKKHIHGQTRSLIVTHFFV